MKKNFMKLLTFIITTILISTILCPSAFAAQTNYVLSFRPGVGGSFSDDAADYLSDFGKVEKTSAGNIFLEAKAGTVLPGDFETMMRSFLNVTGNNYYKSGLSAAGSVRGDETYVAQYGVLKGDGVLYTVSYIDAATGTQLGNPYTGYANNGEEIVFGAKTIDGYTVDAQQKTLKVGTESSISFLYTQVTSTVVITITSTVDLRDEATSTSSTTSTSTTTNETTSTSSEIIEDNSTPMGDGDNDNSTSPGEVIDDNETPLAPGKTPKQNTGLVIGVLATGLLIVVGLIILAKMRKKKT